MDSLVEPNNGIRFVFVGGKGGVGKTTTSSGIAMALANSGRRVLLVSTDPAHSLGDAWRTTFSNDPTKVAEGLWVMEVDPTASMQKELGSWTALAAQFGDTGDKKEGAQDNLGHKIKSFQEWLSGIPGIDEATALSSAIHHIESGIYDVIVFDTAPTGHTVKLLQLPAILQIGLDKLEGWSTTIYSYWESLKGAISTAEEGHRLTATAKREISDKLRKYKSEIQRVGKMLEDTERTRFVVVCIAEFLSVNETKRLLDELETCGVKASHVVVNQLVEEDACLNAKEMAKIEKWASNTNMSDAMKIVASKARNACNLTSSRRSIQSRYLNELRGHEKVKTQGLTLVEVPLLSKEITGCDAIEQFSDLLLSKRLEKAQQQEPATKVQRVLYNEDVHKNNADGASAGTFDSDPLADKIQALLDDPEIKELVDKSPKAQQAVEAIQKNPMSAMSHMADPELQPLIQAAMKKLF